MYPLLRAFGIAGRLGCGLVVAAVHLSAAEGTHVVQRQDVSVPEIIDAIHAKYADRLPPESEQDATTIRASYEWLKRNAEVWPAELANEMSAAERDVAATLVQLQEGNAPPAEVAAVLARVRTDYEIKHRACKLRNPPGPWATVRVRTVKGAENRDIGGYTVSCGSFFRNSAAGAPYIWPAPTSEDPTQAPALRILVGHLRFWATPDPRDPSRTLQRVMTVPPEENVEIVLAVE